MAKFRKILLKVWPYFTSALAGCLFFIFSKKLDSDLKNLMHNISAAFFAIPLLYLIYDLSRSFSQKKLNKELFDYAKMQVDREVLSIVNQLMKMIYPYDERDFSLESIRRFLNKSTKDIRDIISQSKYIGFQAFKNWQITERNLIRIMENPFIGQRLENDQIISVIELLKSLRSLGSIQTNVDDLYLFNEDKVNGFEIKRGTDISARNSEYPDRYILLKKLSHDKFQVWDFGDFEPYCSNKLLNTCKINPKYIEPLSLELADILKEISRWIEITGGEFLMDSKMFRIKLQPRGQEMDTIR